jgi:hypothetical protein
MKYRTLALAAIFFTSVLSYAKGEPIRITTITDTTDPASSEVMKTFRQHLAKHANLFTIVENSNDANLIFTENCMPRKATEPYVCFYITHFAGGTGKTFLGGGIYSAENADDVASNFLASVAQDVVERWENIARANAIETLESCLFLTQSNCAVPEKLVPELKVKVLNLSQYLQKGGLKK